MPCTSTSYSTHASVTIAITVSCSFSQQKNVVLCEVHGTTARILMLQCLVGSGGSQANAERKAFQETKTHRTTRQTCEETKSIRIKVIVNEAKIPAGEDGHKARYRIVIHRSDIKLHISVIIVNTFAQQTSILKPRSRHVAGTKCSCRQTPTKYEESYQCAIKAKTLSLSY